MTAAQAASAPIADGLPVCAVCGAEPGDEAEAAQARLTWSRGLEGSRVVWTCPACTRTHARAIEGKLDSAWW